MAAVLLLQLHPSMETRASASSLVGQSKPTISVLLPTLTFFSFFPWAMVRVLDSASKLTTFPLIALDGHPAKIDPAKNKEAIVSVIIFIMN